MRYLIARVEEGTPLDGLRRLGDHIVIDSLAAELDENTAQAVAALAERERWDSDTWEVVRIPLDGAERLTVGSKRQGEIRGSVGPV